MRITIITPMAKPLPKRGSIICGKMPRGISWKSIAIIIGSPMVSPSLNERTDCVECSISSDAASCVPMRNSSITPITGLGIAVSAHITLLANKDAVGIIQKFVTEAMKGGGKIQADAVTTLPFPAEIQQLLADTPKLVTYLVLAARMAGRK